MKRISLLLLIATTWAFTSTQPTYADTEGCGTGPQSIISEETSNLNGEYGIYIKLSLPGQAAHVTAYAFADSCQTIGETAANGSTWTKVGTKAFTGDTPVSFEIDGSIPGDNDAAARPQLLFVPASTPCSPTVNCNLTLQGSPAYLTPIALATSESGMALKKIIDPASDTIKNVEYYTDGQLMYMQPELSPFNSAYADYYKQKIARVIVYNSGQRAVLEDTVSTYTDNLWNFALRSYARYSTLIITIGLVAIVTTFILITRSIARKIETRNYYNYAHGLGRHILTPLERKIQTFAQNRTLRGVTSGVLLAGGLLVAVVVTNSFVIAPYQVDGTSMYATLHDKQFLAVNKLPVSLNQQFKPKRGEIIIFHPNYGTIVYSDLRVDNLLVKRVVGLPGERVVSVNGKLIVYNSTNPNGYYLEDAEPWGKNVTLQPSDAPFDITLGNDQIFVAGDNRSHSIDSRINGALPLSEVVGVVVGY